jgi:hypothetical protein
VTLLDDTRTWTSVSVGTDTVCGIASGELYCWGANYGGQLGLGDTIARTTPTRVGTDTTWVAVSANVRRHLRDPSVQHGVPGPGRLCVRERPHAFGDG